MVDTHIFSWFWMVDTKFFRVLDGRYPYFFYGFEWLIPNFLWFWMVDTHIFSWFWMVDTNFFSWFWMVDTHIFSGFWMVDTKFFMVLDGWYPYFYGFGWLIPILLWF